jgi:hypothetical protein
LRERRCGQDGREHGACQNYRLHSISPLWSRQFGCGLVPGRCYAA